MKGGLWFLLFGICCLVFFANGVLAIDGVSPGSYSVDFEAGLEEEFVFDFFVEEKSSVGVYGDLAPYVSLDKDEIAFREKVVAYLNFSESAEFKPGVNEIWIVAGGARGVIRINVPYPDKFLKVEINSPSINYDEAGFVDLKIVNLGRDDIYFEGGVFVYSGEEIVREFYLNDSYVAFSEELSYVDFSIGDGYEPGDYEVVFWVDFGGERVVANDFFRVGEFRLEIVNYTREVFDEVVLFEIEIVSFYDGKIRDVFAGVNTENGVRAFDTSIASFEPWEKKILSGFFDASELEGEIVLRIDVYYGDKVESEIVTVEVVDGFSLFYWILGFFAVFLIVFLIWFFRRKSK